MENETHDVCFVWKTNSPRKLCDFSFKRLSKFFAQEPLDFQCKHVRMDLSFQAKQGG